jgi:hypothetical protein
MMIVDDDVEDPPIGPFVLLNDPLLSRRHVTALGPNHLSRVSQQPPLPS